MGKSIGWNWVNKMGNAWINKNPKEIPPLFAEKFKYYESPHEKPIGSKKLLLDLWQDVPSSQKDISFEFEILSEKDGLIISHFKSSFTRIKNNSPVYLDGIFSVKLDKNNLCTKFKWWWNAKENK